MVINMNVYVVNNKDPWLLIRNDDSSGIILSIVFGWFQVVCCIKTIETNDPVEDHSQVCFNLTLIVFCTADLWHSCSIAHCFL